MAAHGVDSSSTMTAFTTVETAVDARRVGRAEVATYVAFGGCGVAMATWASRIPQVRDQLELEPSALGLVLLAVAAGSLISLPMSGPLVGHFGSRRVVAAMAILFGLGMSTVGVGYQIGVFPVVVGLVIVGFAAGAWDVAMNVHGAFVEQLLGRSVMSRFHAGFSLGTVVGALVGAAMVAGDVSVTVHLIAFALAISASVALFTRWFLAEHHQPDEPVAVIEADLVNASSIVTQPVRGHFASWKESRTVLIGVFVLAFAFAEGVGNDWIAVAVIDGYGAPEAVGTLVFATFLAAMTLGRWFGPGLLDRHGRTRVVRPLAVTGIVGVLVFVFAPVTWLALIGAVLWGLGTSLGFPVGMSAGADDAALAAGRVSVISTIGYCAFLVGPPLIGLLGEHSSVLRALIAVAVLLALAASIASIVEPRRSARSSRSNDGGGISAA
jgi:MFS family permease